MSHHKDDADDVGHNDSGNTPFETVLRGYLSRRGVLKGSVGTAATLLLGAGLAACGDDDDTAEPPPPPPPPPPSTLQLNFNPVAKSVADALIVPAGYTASVLYALGDPISAGVADYTNNGSESGASFAQRAGDQHDGMEYFGLGAGNTHAPDSSTRGLICINHENITQIYLHAGAPSAAPRVADEALKEINAHGIAVFEVERAASGAVSVVRNSALNRRVTPNTPMDLHGPAAGTAWMRTQLSATGTNSYGTLNNCATGRTPWGTFLTCEENWAGYFRRNAGDNATRGGDTSKAVRSLNRYGVPQGASGSYQWATATAADPADWTFRRWNATQTGASLDGTDDFRNEPFTFGYVVEIDPFSPAAAPRKRTALGRMGHESAAYAAPVAGQPIVYYQGDDARGEYIYKFVSSTPWSAADANTGGLAAGDKYLNAGTLYVAKFNADGTGQWLPLTLANPAVAGSDFAFADEAEICIHTRIAADAAGATPMDRPEWTAVNPRNGDVYVTLTNNNSAFRSYSQVDAANPRSYGSGNGSNDNGHIIRLKEAGGLGSATTFQWDIYLFGAPAASPANVNISGLTDANDFSSPDGLWFDKQGVCWIQTDDGAYTGTTNCMMLAAIPGAVGDGGSRTVNNAPANGTSTVTTYVASAANSSEANLRRFLVGPAGCEITGIAMTPDLKTMFVNIQHPGESGNLATLQSSWPAAPGSNARPRSATVVVTKTDGGTIGGSLV